MQKVTSITERLAEKRKADRQEAITLRAMAQVEDVMAGRGWSLWFLSDPRRN